MQSENNEKNFRTLSHLLKNVLQRLGLSDLHQVYGQHHNTIYPTPYVYTLELPQSSNQMTTETGLADEHLELSMCHQSENSIKKNRKIQNGHNSYNAANKSKATSI